MRIAEQKIRDLLNPSQVSAHHLKDDGPIPNNPKLPLLIYQAALNLSEENPASAIENLLASNKWGGSWRNGIYNFHHYHSTAHEVLIFYSGSATVQLGGEKGITQIIRPGDAMIIPAGVGHKNLGSSSDFAIVGAYPKGQAWDMCYGKPGERPKADQNIARVPLPKADPLYGDHGSLMEHWRQ